MEEETVLSPGLTCRVEVSDRKSEGRGRGSEQCLERRGAVGACCSPRATAAIDKGIRHVNSLIKAQNKNKNAVNGHMSS